MLRTESRRKCLLQKKHHKLVTEFQLLIKQFYAKLFFDIVQFFPFVTFAGAELWKTCLVIVIIVDDIVILMY